MRTSSAIRLVLIALFAPSCISEDPGLPTRGLTPGQLQSTFFLEKQAVLDLRLDEEPRSRRDQVIPKRFRFGEGWFNAEPHGRWALGERSTLSVYVSDPEDLSLVIECRGIHVQLLAGVLVNGVAVGQVRPTSEWKAHSLELDVGVLRPGLNLIEFAFQSPPNPPPQLRLGDPATIVREMIGDVTPSTAHLRDLLPVIREVFPAASIHGDDVLNLPGVDAADVIASPDDKGVGGGWQWSSLGPGSLSAQFRTIALVEPSESIAAAMESSGLGIDGGTLSVRRSGELFIPLESKAPMWSLTFAASTRAGFGRAADLGLSLASDGDLQSLGGDRLDGLWGRTAYADTLRPGDLSGPACLVVEVDVDPTGDPVAIEAVELESAPSEPKRPPVELPSSPDIVLIVLDAARPDHFGCYGYERDTTPDLDRLAAESLVFTNAFATAAYTTCSMPTTLAESLRQRGYRTSCLSANPNNAIERGLGQGCDTFEELWRDRSRAVAWDPYLMSALANERLAEDSGAPQFLMLHYIPPHEPYVPRPEFDIFGNDDYDGAVDGTVQTLHRINGGRLVPTEDDLGELVALYDGNLRTADDAVRRVIDTLRRRDRWNQTVVLVTSDHGEAFLEHGRVGHNTTVYDEMLRVPFILRLPEEAVANHVDTEQLVSLEDVVPTLLGLAGADVADDVSGVDLLSPNAPSGQRGIVARSAHAPRILAYRTPAWTLIERSDALEVYDARTDPLQRNNVYLEEFGRTLCLRSLLELEVSRPEPSIPERSDELDQEALDALRSLGYVR